MQKNKKPLGETILDLLLKLESENKRVIRNKRIKVIIFAPVALTIIFLTYFSFFVIDGVAESFKFFKDKIG